MSSYKEQFAEDARLTILQELNEEQSLSLNETMLRRALKAAGMNRDGPWVRSQMKIMEGKGVITITIAGSIFIAVLTKVGRAHIERSALVDGISPPEPE